MGILTNYGKIGELNLSGLSDPLVVVYSKGTDMPGAPPTYSTKGVFSVL